MVKQMCFLSCYDKDTRAQSLRMQMNRFFQIPSEKQRYPMTSSQIHGWFRESLVHQPHSSALTTRMKKQCNETNFGEVFFRLKGYSQYSNQNK